MHDEQIPNIDQTHMSSRYYSSKCALRNHIQQTTSPTPALLRQDFIEALRVHVGRQFRVW